MGEKGVNMKKLFLKMMWANKRAYTLVIFGGTFVMSIVYASVALIDCLLYVTTGKPGSMTSIIFGFESAFTFSYFFLFILIVLLLMSYIKKRISDYIMLDALGMKRKHKYRFILTEYLGIIISSMVFGILLGTIEAEIIKKILKKVFADRDVIVEYSSNSIILTIIVSVIIFGLSFIVLDEIISCLGIDAFTHIGSKGGRIFRNSRLYFAIGIGFLAIAILTLYTYWGKVGKVMPVFFVMVGMLLFMLSVMEIYLSRQRRDANKYYKNIVWLDNWYQRFFYNVNMSYIVGVFVFVLVFLFSVTLMDNTPVKEESNYPYELVWMANDTDVPFVNKLEKKYNLKVDNIPCIRVTTPDFGEHMGISVKQYEKLTGKHLNLKSGEVHIVYQREREDYNVLGIDYGRRKPRIHIGKAEYELWIFDVPKPIPSAKFDTTFQIKGEENRIITGVFESRQIGQLKGNVFENIIVFSDDYYNKVSENAKGANLALMINLDGAKEAIQEIQNYAKQYSEVNFFDYKGGNLIYEKDKLMLESRQVKLCNVASMVINILIFTICACFVIFIKCENELLLMQHKYKFYTDYGMSKRKRKVNIYKERQLIGRVALVIGVPISMIFVLIELISKHLDSKWYLSYCFGIFVVILGTTMVILLTNWAMGKYTYNNIERGTNGKRKN